MSDRLTALDNSFLQLEDGTSAHMHVAAVMVFEGDPPPHDDVLAAIESRLHLVPRYRQKLAFAPGGQARPQWIDDPHFNLRYHVRRTALPPPGGERELRVLAGRVFSQRLDRDKPLWEMWLAEGLTGERHFAILSKTHHALVDGISGVDLVTVLFDLEPEPPPPLETGEPWYPRPEPSRVSLLADAARDRVGGLFDIPAAAMSAVRSPGDAVRVVREAAAGVGALTWTRAAKPAPRSIYNVAIGPHRRFTWVRASLGEFKAIKNSLGGTVNDVVLAAVAGALRSHLHRRGQTTRGLELKAMVPVSTRAEAERGALGNRVATMYAPLPLGIEPPGGRLRAVSESMRELKQSGQTVGARVLTELTGFAPPTIMAQAARQAASAKMFNVTITNVPGPQYPLFTMGREMVEIFPMVPLAPEHALGIAIMSYNGGLNFGLVGDYDALWDIDDLAEDLDGSIAELADAAGVRHEGAPAAERTGTDTVPS